MGGHDIVVWKGVKWNEGGELMKKNDVGESVTPRC